MYILGIDIGTTGAKSVVFDLEGNAISKGYVEYPIDVPQPGWAQQDANTWWNSTIQSVKVALGNREINSTKIACVGISSQINTPTLIDENGNILDSSILWMDKRADPDADWIRRNIGERKFVEITGVKTDPFYTCCKLLWVKNNQPKVFEKTEVVLQAKDFINYRLTGEYIIDKALASSCGFLDTRNGNYATGLLERIGIPIEKLPKIVSSDVVIGEINDKAAKQTDLVVGTPVIAGTGDVMSNAVGSGVVETGLAYNKTATASDLVLCVNQPVIDPEFRVVSYRSAIPEKWLLMAGDGVGICYRWFRDKFAQPENEIAKNINKDPYEILDMEAQQVEPGADRLIFLPYLMGARSPIWNSKARGVFFGISINHDKRHFARAILEGIAYSVRHRIDIIENLGANIMELRLVGGGAKSELWRQIMADVYRKPIALLNGEEQECLGVAILGSLGISIYKDVSEAVDRMVRVIRRTEPHEINSEKYKKLFRIYLGLYESVREYFYDLYQI